MRPSAHRKAPVANEKGKRVFVVDDEKVIATTLAIILTQSGFVAESFTEPTQALSSAMGDVPNLLISDVMMPGMNGIDLAIAMREKCPDCKILLFSGQSATADLLKDARTKGHDFQLLQKPIHPTDLLNAIRGLTTPSVGPVLS